MIRILYTAILVFSLMLCACNRKEFKSYKGQYECQLAVHKWVSGGLNEYTITPGYLIEVYKEKKNVYILGHLIHIDSIEPSFPYEWEAGEKQYSLTFFNDSLRYAETVLGDTSTSNIYIGGKID